MFGFFKRKKAEEAPLSDLKTVSRWLQDMPSGDIYTALENVVQTLMQFNHGGLPASKDRLQVLMHLDEQARDMQAALCTQYLRNPRMSKVIESRLWTAVHAYFWEITRGYHTFLMEFTGKREQCEFAAAAPLITARAIRGFADIFKWRYIRYERGDDKLWSRLHNLYRIAEQHQFLGNRFKLYPNDAQSTSCQEEYARPLLLAPLGTGNLLPRQIDMVDHWLDNWSALPLIQSAYDPKQHFYFVDLSVGHGPRSIQSGEKSQADYRYLATPPLLARLSEVEKALRGGAMPATLGLGEDFRLPDGYDLIDHVFREWAPRGERDRRHAGRQAQSGFLEVLHDLLPICRFLEHEARQVRASPTQPRLSPEELLAQKLYGGALKTASPTPAPSVSAEVPELERWTQIDRGETGVGVVLDPEECDWVKVGKLVCFRTDPATPWRLGMIRRITRLQNEQRKIGVLMYPGSPVQIRLEAVDPGFRSPPGRDTPLIAPAQNFTALAAKDQRGETVVVLDAQKFAPGRRFHLLDLPGDRQIQLGAARDKGDGWLMATYTDIQVPI